MDQVGAQGRVGAGLGSAQTPRSPGRFAGQVALVTGGASGIGFAAVERLLVEGATVWILDRDIAAAHAVAERCTVAGLAARAAQLDVADGAAFERVVSEIDAAEGRIDVLVNNAGVVHAGSVWETTHEDWARVVAINLTGTFNGIRAVFPVMMRAGRGAIVNISSDWGLVGAPGEAAYVATKTGVVGLTRAAAMDGASHGIRTNAVCPGYTQTPLLDGWVAAQEDPVQAMADIAAHQPLGRVGTAYEVAALIAFLASCEAGFITGAAVPVDGGVTAR
jgi:NAD(P)-dependent dehydrogenase (short-subunit alcohol dehydrogenase family)